MKLTRRRAIGASALMFGAVALGTLGTPNQLLSKSYSALDLEASIPRVIGDWTVDSASVPILPSPDVQATLGKIYDQTVNRTYVNSTGQRVMLSIAYGGAQTRQLRAHRQEVCYSAQGFQVSKLRRERLELAGASLPVAKMIAKQGNRIEPVMYWFTMGDYAVMSLWDRQKVQFLYSLKNQIPDGFLVRFSSISENETEAFDLQSRFAEEMFAKLPPEVAGRLLGTKN
ncbi:exosortase-associated protein EpsI, B-type [Roseateles albus]|uniref:EpsI family protein n=1 Tax=Roseateles albus TaxID=2987525 RepID=A0ABT5KDV5_9BURK|nr:exosortase-associated protein EpsI, B-type [Roseateles albus]MDC8772073.1 EpsI family protein [Roseateles albus]